MDNAGTYVSSRNTNVPTKGGQLCSTFIAWTGKGKDIIWFIDRILVHLLTFGSIKFNISEKIP